MHVNTNKPYRNLHRLYKQLVPIEAFTEEFGHITNPNKHSTYTLYILESVLPTLVYVHGEGDPEFRINRINIVHSYESIMFNDRALFTEVCDVFIQTNTSDTAFRLIPPHAIKNKVPIEDALSVSYVNMNLSREQFEFMPVEINGEIEFPVKKHQLDVVMALFDKIVDGDLHRDDFIYLCIELYKITDNMENYDNISIVDLSDPEVVHKNPTHNKIPIFFLCDTLMKSIMNEKTGSRFLIIVHRNFVTGGFPKVAELMDATK